MLCEDGVLSHCSMGGSPSNMMVPELVDSSPAIMRKRVVLPARTPADLERCSEAVLATRWAARE